MPHLSIEYSANLETVIDMSALCEALRASAAQIESFPMPGLRVRALRADHYAIADGDPKHGFIDISLRLRAGRTPEIKAEATAQLFETAEGVIAPYLAEHSIALSFEMRDIDPALSPKSGSIRAHLTQKET